MTYVATGDDAKASSELKTALTKASNAKLQQTIEIELKKLAG